MDEFGALKELKDKLATLKELMIERQQRRRSSQQHREERRAISQGTAGPPALPPLDWIGYSGYRTSHRVPQRTSQLEATEAEIAHLRELTTELKGKVFASRAGYHNLR